MSVLNVLSTNFEGRNGGTMILYTEATAYSIDDKFARFYLSAYFLVCLTHDLLDCVKMHYISSRDILSKSSVHQFHHIPQDILDLRTS
jgi:hypothetical protein